jgi:hypothetical protein
MKVRIGRLGAEEGCPQVDADDAVPLLHRKVGRLSRGHDPSVEDDGAEGTPGLDRRPVCVLQDGDIASVPHDSDVVAAEALHDRGDRCVEIDADDGRARPGETLGDGLAEPASRSGHHHATRRRGFSLRLGVNGGQLCHPAPPCACGDGNTLGRFLTMMRLD